ncbi:MAG: hemerythrin domain-containing protein [Variovorax sp.]|nr:hemerythrin domain-containing protein [Variovorax sp.]
MNTTATYDDAVDLLEADHQAVKKMFIDYGALCDDAAPATAKRALAQRICQALTVHAQIEEEIFYPQVRKVLGDDALMDEAIDEHAAAKALIAEIQAMKAPAEGYDSAVKQLGALIDAHVLHEREQIFLSARYTALDLRAMAVPLMTLQQKLKKAIASAPAKETT